MSLVWFIGSVLVTPFLVILLCIVFLASIGKSLGVRRLYVKLLLIIFEVSVTSFLMTFFPGTLIINLGIKCVIESMFCGVFGDPQ